MATVPKPVSHRSLPFPQPLQARSAAIQLGHRGMLWSGLRLLFCIGLFWAWCQFVSGTVQMSPLTGATAPWLLTAGLSGVAMLAVLMWATLQVFVDCVVLTGTGK